MWKLLCTAEGVEYWLHEDSRQVYRRRESQWNIITPDGTPSGVRWECSLEHFQRHYVTTWWDGAPAACYGEEHVSHPLCSATDEEAERLEAAGLLTGSLEPGGWVWRALD